jgi:hypothetical protein
VFAGSCGPFVAALWALRGWVIVGRSRELALLEQTLDGAARGGASRLLLVGEA